MNRPILSTHQSSTQQLSYCVYLLFETDYSKGANQGDFHIFTNCTHQDVFPRGCIHVNSHTHTHTHTHTHAYICTHKDTHSHTHAHEDRHTYRKTTEFLQQNACLALYHLALDSEVKMAAAGSIKLIITATRHMSDTAASVPGSVQHGWK